MRTSRSTSSVRPVASTTPKNTSSTIVNSGVKRRASTGAMFSIRFCLVSTSQAATSTPPMAPGGRIHCSKNGSMSIPMASKIPNVNPPSTPPPRAMST